LNVRRIQSNPRSAILPTSTSTVIVEPTLLFQQQKTREQGTARSAPTPRQTPPSRGSLAGFLFPSKTHFAATDPPVLRSDTTPTRPRRRCPEQTDPYELRLGFNNSPIDAADPHESALVREGRFYFSGAHVSPAGFPFFFRANTSNGEDCFLNRPAIATSTSRSAHR